MSGRHPVNHCHPLPQPLFAGYAACTVARDWRLFRETFEVSQTSKVYAPRHVSRFISDDPSPARWSRGVHGRQ
jgi:hypothetical protein